MAVKTWLPSALVVCLLFPAASAWSQNVILFVGDGMGISTVTAARIFAGQRRGLDGEEYQLAFDRFEHVALVKTYNVDAQVPDSAGTISALLTGQKTRIGVLGITADVERDDCAASLKHQLPTIAELAEEAGYATGVVSTTRITHATPAGAYAHVPNRDWEDSSSISDAAKQQGCRDIASQLLEFQHGDGIDVILGGGRAQFLPRQAQDPEYPEQSGKRDDQRDLIEEWRQQRSNRTFVWRGEEFQRYQPRVGHQLMGLFEPSHLKFEADRKKDPGQEPSLAQMTKLAIKQLQLSQRGYFLLVEGGRIDHAHHFSNAYRALLDTVALSDAVAAAEQMVDLSNTLIIVTADHSHTLTISGYPQRGNPILGKVARGGKPTLDLNGNPYTTLSYANGPGSKAPLPDLTTVDTTAADYQQLGMVPLSIETHGGEDVAAFATGVNAGGVRGVMEQNKLFDVMLEALFSE